MTFILFPSFNFLGAFLVRTYIALTVMLMVMMIATMIAEIFIIVALLIVVVHRIRPRVMANNGLNEHITILLINKNRHFRRIDQRQLLK